MPEPYERSVTRPHAYPNRDHIATNQSSAPPGAATDRKGRSSHGSAVVRTDVMGSSALGGARWKRSVDNPPEQTSHRPGVTEAAPDG